MFENLWARFRSRPIDSVSGFTEFLERNAWLVTQKSVIGYCNVKTKLPIHELLRESEFADAYDIAIWESYAAVLADLCEIGLGYLRGADPIRAREFADELALIFDARLAAHPLPKHRIERGWSDESAAIRPRLARAMAESPRPIRKVAAESARRVFAVLPIHERLREADGPAVKANVEFLMVGLAHEFDAIDYRAVAREMAPAPAPS